MFIPHLQLSQLETYLHGFETGLTTAGQYDFERSFSREFAAFVHDRRGWSMQRVGVGNLRGNTDRRECVASFLRIGG
jgi:hypothetical protein